MTDNTRVNDLQNKLLQAMDIINAQALNSIAFDKTIICTIESDTYRKDGKYDVSDGSKIFTAFSSDTSLRTGDNVYVTIPEGNYENQKIIIGKKTDETAKPFVFTTPFDNIYDMTDNIVAGKVEDGALVANALNNYGKEENKEYEIITLCDQDCNYYGYTRLGLKANFKSWIKQAVRGEYGLAIILTAQDFNIASSQAIKEETYYYTFSNTDMYGNPYDFATDYEQEFVIPLENIQGTISHIKINFYQKANFYDKFNEPIPCSQKGFATEPNTNIYIKDENGNYTLPEGDSILDPNIFVKDIYMCLGYDISIFTSDMVQLYTQASNTYKHSNTVGESGINQNRKGLKVRWVHIDENGNPVDMVAAADEENGETPYEVRWYRYSVGAPAADTYCGVYWTRIKNAQGFQYNFDPDIDLQQEKIKVIIIYNSNTPYRSNELIFENEEDLPPSAEAQHIANALTIVVDDGTNGNYMIYGQDNSIKDTEYGKKTRTLSAWFDVDSSGELESNEKITVDSANDLLWTFPASNTMIELLDANKEAFYDTNGYVSYYQTRTNEPWYKINSYYSPNYSNNTITCQYTLNERVYTTEKEFTFGPAGTMGSDQTLVIDILGDKNSVDLEDSVVSFEIQLYDNQNVKQDIPDGQVVWAWYYNSDLPTNTKFPLVIENENNSILNWTTTNIDINNLYILQATVGKLTTYFPVPISNGYSYIKGPTQVIYQSNGEPAYNREAYQLYGRGDVQQCDAKWRVRIDRDYYEYKSVVEADSVNEETFNQDTYYILVEGNYRQAREYNKDEQYYTRKVQNKQCYLDSEKQLQLIAAENISNLIPAEIIQYTPELNSDNKLQPISIYVEDAPIYGVQAIVNDTVVWTQPILVLQNLWPNGVINAWDGKSLVLDEETGTILAAAISAGKKNSDNTFSGVMLGDWGDKDVEGSISKQTGVYGFHHGAMSYAFKEDGTAFIGKSSMARINFDGSNATIYSSGYNTTSGGMMINLYNNGEPYISLKSRGNSDSDDYSEMRFDTKTSGSTIKLKRKEIEINGEKYAGGDIIISNENTLTPLKIGSDFSVSWQGGIKANSGTIGSWKINHPDNGGALQSDDGKIVLSTEGTGTIKINNTDIVIRGSYYDTKEKKQMPTQMTLSSDSIIHGGIIEAGTLRSNSDSSFIALEGYITVGEGSFGYVKSNAPETTDPDGIGILYNKNQSRIVATGTNAGIAFGNASIAVYSGKIGMAIENYSGGFGLYSYAQKPSGLSGAVSGKNVLYTDVPPENQFGIYARFA